MTTKPLEPHEEMAALAKLGDLDASATSISQKPPNMPSALSRDDDNAVDDDGPEMVRFIDYMRLMDEKNAIAQELDDALEQVELMQGAQEENVYLKDQVKTLERDIDLLSEELGNQMMAADDSPAQASSPPSKKPSKQLTRRQTAPIVVSVTETGGDEDDSSDASTSANKSSSADASRASGKPQAAAAAKEKTVSTMVIETVLPGAKAPEDDVMRSELEMAREHVAMLQERLRDQAAQHEAELEDVAQGDDRTIKNLQKLVATLQANNEELMTAAMLHDQERDLLEQQIDTLHMRVQETEADLIEAQSRAVVAPPSRPDTAASLSRPGTAPTPTSKGPQFFNFSEEDVEDNARLRELLEKAREENDWLARCLHLVRAQHRDDQVKLPKKKGTEFSFATKQRAEERELIRNMDVVLNYLSDQGVPPESPTPRQVVILYQRCLELEKEAEKNQEQLVEALGELDTIRSLCKAKKGSALSAVNTTIDALADTQQKNFELEEELAKAKENFSLMDEQLRLLDGQLAEQGVQYQNAVESMEKELAEREQALKQEKSVVLGDKEGLLREMRNTVASLEATASSTEDPHAKRRLATTVANLNAVIEDEETKQRMQAEREGKGVSDGAGLSLKAIGSSKTTQNPYSLGTRSAQQSLLRSPTKAPEILAFDRDMAQSGDAASDAVAHARRRMVDQESRHQAELQELVNHSAAMQKKQMVRLRELEHVAEMSENDLQEEVFALEQKVQELTHERDTLRASLDVSEENLARMQQVAEHHHEHALELEASLEVDMASLQEGVKRQAAAHTTEVEKLKALLSQSDGDQLRAVEGLEHQIRRLDAETKEKDSEIAKLLGDMKRQRENTTKQFDHIERQHDEEMSSAQRRHELQVAKQDAMIKALQDEAHTATQRLGAAQQQVSALTAELERVKGDLEDAAEQHNQDRAHMMSTHREAMADTGDLIEDMKKRHQENVTQLEGQLAAAQAELQHAHDQQQSVATALDLKETELQSVRDAFDEERRTHEATLNQLVGDVHELENEVSALKGAKTSQAQELTAIVREKDLRIGALEDENDMLKAELDVLGKNLESTATHFEAEMKKKDMNAEGEKERDRALAAATTAQLKKRIGTLADERNQLKAEIETLTAQARAERANLIQVNDATTSDLAAAKAKYDTDTEKLRANVNEKEAECRDLEHELKGLRNAIAQHFRETQRASATCASSPSGHALNNTTTNASAFNATGVLGETTSAEGSAHHGRGSSGNSQQLIRAATHMVLDLERDFLSIADRTEALVAELESTQHKCDELQNQCSSTSSTLKQAEASARASQHSNSALETRLQTAKDRVAEIERENQDLKSRMASLQEELKDQAASAAANQSHLGSILDSVKAGFASEKENFHQQVEGLRSDLHAAQDRIGELRAQARAQEEEIELLQSQVQAEEAAKDGLKQALSAQKMRSAGAEEQLARVGEEAARHEADAAENLAAARRAQEELANANTYAAALQEDLEQTREEYQTAASDNARLKQVKEDLEARLADHELVKQQRQNSAYEVEVLKRELEEQREELDRTHQMYLAAKSQASREKRNQSAIAADLERQLGVAKARQAKEKQALAKLDAQVKELVEEKTRLEREATKQRSANLKLQGQVQEHANSMREKERTLLSMRKRNASLEDDLSKLQTQKRTMESRLRRDQSRRVMDLSRSMDRTAFTSRVAADHSFILNSTNQATNASLLSMDASVRNVAAGLRGDRLASTAKTINTTTAAPSADGDATFTDAHNGTQMEQYDE